jgi:DNA-binding response OmpR family regulator
MTPIPKVLLVDDKLENLIALEGTLASLDIECIRALSGTEALQQVLRQQFALLIIDVQMPEMDGYQLVELLRQSEEHKGLPVIFISAIYFDDYYKIKGFEVGAIDFIAKPFVPEILVSKVRNFLELHTYKMGLISKNTELIQLNQQLQEEIKNRQINQQLQEEIKNRKKFEATLRISNEALKQSLEICKDRLQYLYESEKYSQFIKQAQNSIQAANKMLNSNKKNS